MLTTDEQLNIDYDLYTKVIQGTFKSSFAMFLNILVIAIAFYQPTNGLFLTAWVFLGSLVILLRSLDVHNYLKERDIQKLSFHIQKFKIYSLLTAIVVSSGIIILTPNHLPFHQAFLAMIVAGLSAGAVMALSYYQTIVRLYLVILIVPFASLMLLQGTTIHLLISFLMFLFLTMLMLFSKTFYANTIELIESKNEANIQAHYDIITELPNRLTLYDRLFVELQRIKRHKTFAAILFIDIDDFKTINDTYGHHQGDAVLKEFSQIISSVARAEDTFARLSGDEFVILVSSIHDSKEEAIRVAQKIANKVHQTLKSPLKVDDKYIFVTVSIGIDIIDETTQNSDRILNNADTAIYKSKKDGKNKTTLYTKAT